MPVRNRGCVLLGVLDAAYRTIVVAAVLFVIVIVVLIVLVVAGVILSLLLFAMHSRWLMTALRACAASGA